MKAPPGKPGQAVGLAAWPKLQEGRHHDWNKNTCTNAAKGEVLQWVRANKCPWNENTCCWAVEGGHLEVLKWAKRLATFSGIYNTF